MNYNSKVSSYNGTMKVFFVILEDRYMERFYDKTHREKELKENS